MAWSPYKNRVIEFVRENPGCCKMDVANCCTRSWRRDPSRQYHIVNTAIRNGWIRAVKHSDRYELFVD